ncbi:MAG: hypothetical protein CMG66_04375 [Candidatus Marinimicrobia bacterium]|nr:hypothetical protein [Candidatus Neomarinimicrobiota bacterium]
MKNIIIAILMSLCFSAYNVGDLISNSHLNQEFEICYPSAFDNTMRLSDYNGSTNGGDYHVLVIDMSATWCGPCQSLIPLFDDLEQVYSNNQYVELFIALSDLNQPYSCTQWGNLGDSGIPKIINDTGYPIFNMFNTGSSFPSLVMIDHEMKVHYKEAGYYNTFVSDASEIIDEMLSNMENSLILSNGYNLFIGGGGGNGPAGDGDDLLNPGEPFDLEFSISNNSFYLDALNVTAAIESQNDLFENYDDINFINSELNFGDIFVDQSSFSILSGLVGDNVFIGEHNFELIVTAGYIDLNGNYSEFSSSYPFSINVSLDQSGFPYDTNSEVKSSPAVVDLDGDGSHEIIFGDNAGLIHVLDASGFPVFMDTFPYDTGNQIWGSPAIADIDNDGMLDVVFVSKNKHLYVFDQFGLKLDYNANQYLIGTPAIGNLDDDSDLEIVFGGFSNNAELFVINIDGSDVDGFPLFLDEKMQKGVALADFNNNGKDDIVLGTEDDNIYLVYDDGSIGFSFLTDDKIRSAPIVIDISGEKIIVVGSKDGNLYALDSNGGLHFNPFDSGSAIYTSPTVLDTPSGLMIFFGNNEGELFAVDINGNLKDGFPIEFIDQDVLLPFSSIVGSVVFEDLNSDGLAELVFGDESGRLHVLKSSDNSYSEFSYYNNMPFSDIFAYASSLNIQDIDNDGDLEIFGGTTGDMMIVDIKESASLNGYWNIYRGNYRRNGLIESISLCSAGDINNDGILDILDIVSLVNIVMNPQDLSELEACAADMNGDIVIDILDIVTLVNSIIG